MSQQLSRIGTVWAVMLVVGTAVLTFAGLTFAVGTSETSPTDAPRVRAITAPPAPVAAQPEGTTPPDSKTKRKRAAATKDSGDSFEEFTRAEARRARKRLRAARRRRLQPSQAVRARKAAGPQAPPAAAARPAPVAPATGAAPANPKAPAAKPAPAAAPATRMPPASTTTAPASTGGAEAKPGS